MDNYQLYEDPIGKGQNSIVYKSRYKKSITYYAIKCVPKSQKETVTNQVRILNVLNHVNVMKFYSWYETNNHFWIILEYCAGGDLLSVLNQDLKLPESTIRIFATDIVNGLQHVHANGFLYGDLKPSNILLNGSGMLKLADFGMAQQITILREEDVLMDRSETDPKKIIKAKRGTPAYMSPELFQGAQQSICSDFWALGCVLYQMATSKPPFVTEQGLGELMEMIIHEDFAPLEGYSEDFVDLVSGLLRKDPGTRYSWKDIRNHVFFSGEVEQAGPKQDYFLEIPDIYKTWSKMRKATEKWDQVQNLGAQANQGKDLAHEKVLRASVAQYAEIKMEREHGPSYENNSGISHGARSVADVEYDFQHEQTDSTDRNIVEDQYVSASEDEGPSNFNDMHEEGYHIQPEMELNEPTHHQFQRKSSETMLNRRGSISEPAAEGKLARTHDETMARMSLASTTLIQDLLFVPADSYVKPIANNPRIEPIYPTKYDESALSFTPHTLEQVLRMPQKQLESYFTTIYRAIGKSQRVEKLNTLDYFEVLCKDTKSANLLINSSLMKLFIKISRTNKSPEIRFRIFNIMGLLLRFATVISTDLMNSGLYEALLENTQHENLKVCRKATATLGELLFYVATQPIDKTKPQDIWTVPNQVISGIIAATKPNKDEIIQHYAVKTIENICGHSKEFSHRFTCAETVTNLVHIYQNTHNELLKSSVFATLSRMARYKTSMPEQLLSTLGPRTFVSIISNVKDANLKSIQNCLNIINLAFSNNPDSHATRQLLEVENQKFTSSLMKLIDHSNAVIRSKAILSTALLCRMDMEAIVRCCDEKLCDKIDKIIAKDTDAHSQQCMNLLVDSLSEMVFRILKRTISMMDESKLRLSVTKNKCISDLNVVLSILTSPTLSQRTADESVVRFLSKNFVLLKGLRTNGIQIVQALLSIVEIISQHYALNNCHTVVTEYLLPTIIHMLSSEDSNTRFLCLKIFTDILIRFLCDPSIYDISHDEEIGSSTQLLNQLIITQLLPLYDTLLVDIDPIPLYALKLLNNIAEQNVGFISIIKENHPGIILKLFDFFRLEHKNNNVHNVRLMLKVIASDVLPADYIHKQNLVAKLISILEYSTENGIESFFEPSLGIVDCLLYKTSRLVQQCQSNSTKETYLHEQANALYEHNEHFCHLLPIFIHLCCHKDITIAEASAHILLLLSRLYGHSHKEIFQDNHLQQIKTALMEYKESDADDSICQFILKMIYLVIQHTPVLKRKISDPEMIHILQELANGTHLSHQVAGAILEKLGM